VVYVDSRERPRAACLLAGDACYLAGSSSENVFFDAVNVLLPRDRYSVVFAGARIAAVDLARATRGLYMLPARRRAAFLHRPPGVVPAPAGVEFLAIDRAVLEGIAPGADAIREEVLDEWQTQDAFLDRGFGTAALSGGRVVAHSIVDYIVDGACEMGVRVVPDHRRRGIGTAVAAATAQQAFARGLRSIVWHSWANNAGSIAISRELGFGEEVFYTVLMNHWAAENITDLSQDEFRAFGEEYEQLFAETPPAESGYPYVVAATAWASGRDRARCLTNLHRAVDMGWLTSLEQLRELWPELFYDATLPERVPEWAALFTRLLPAAS
jgi:RimJ/RimL family protein N-acetyltransferase